MCASKQAANRRAATSSGPAMSSRVSSSPKAGPSTARWLIASSKASAREKTADPVHGSGNRAPSSLAHETATTGATVRTR